MAADRTQIRIALVKTGINTQVRLAREIGMDRARLSMIFNGWVDPRDDEKRAIATALHASVARLFPKDHDGACAQ